MGEGASYKYSCNYTKKPVATQNNAKSTLAQNNINQSNTQVTAKTQATTADTPQEKERPELLKGIVVFSKDGCSKCERTKKFLTEKNKKFTVLNITKVHEDNEYMWKKLKETGFAGGSVQTPVVMIDGRVFYNMDLTSFLENIK